MFYKYIYCNENKLGRESNKEKRETKLRLLQRMDIGVLTSDDVPIPFSRQILVPILISIFVI